MESIGQLPCCQGGRAVGSSSSTRPDLTRNIFFFEVKDIALRFYYHTAPLACSKIHKHLTQHEIFSNWGRYTVKWMPLYVRLSLTGFRKINSCCRTLCVCMWVYCCCCCPATCLLCRQVPINAVGVSLGLKVTIATRKTGWKVWHFNSVDLILMATFVRPSKETKTASSGSYNLSCE